MFVFYLALRYARARLINLVAVLAVALCLTVQIVVMSILDGMLVEMQKRMAQMGEQVMLGFAGSLPTSADRARLEKTLRKKNPNIIAVTPRITGFGALSKGGAVNPVMIMGLDLRQEMPLIALPDQVTGPRLDRVNPHWLAPKDRGSSLPGIIIGKRTAENLRVGIGDHISLNSLNGNDPENVTEQIFIVGNIFLSGNSWEDNYKAFIPLSTARQLFLPKDLPGREKRARQFSIWLKDPLQAAASEKSIVKAAEAIPGIQLSYYNNWQRRWASAWRAMMHENMLQEIVMLLMNLSGGFCVFAIMATLVSRRVKDIGLLRCLGAGRRQVVIVFILVGLLIGVVGSLLGVAGGYFLTAEVDPRFGARIALWWYEISGEKLFPPRMFGVEKLPIYIAHWKVFLYACGATLIAILATVYPAIWGGTRQPVEALRDE